MIKRQITNYHSRFKMLWIALYYQGGYAVTRDGVYHCLKCATIWREIFSVN